MNPTLKKVLLVLIIWGAIAQLYSMFFWTGSKSLSSSSGGSSTELLAPKQRRAFFDHMYENSTSDGTEKPRKSRKKRLNEKKENKMTKEFLDLVTNYAVKFNGFRLALRDSNPYVQLGFYQDVSYKYYDQVPESEKNFDKPHLGLINDPSYCEVSDFNNLYDPTLVLSSINYFTDYDKDTKFRTQLLSALGKDLMPQISQDMNETIAQEKKYLLNYNISLFFTKDPEFHYYHEMGKNFLCSHQLYNHIPGNKYLSQLHLLDESLQNYTKEADAKCLNKKVVFPVTYRLQKKDECKAFFKELSQPSDKGYSSFIMRYKYTSSKVKVFELDPREKESFVKQFDDGAECGSKKTPIIAQQYSNPRMINSTHFILVRSYMLVSSTNPLIIHYHDGHFVVMPLIEQRATAKLKYDRYEEIQEGFSQFDFDRLEKILNPKRRVLKSQNADEATLEAEKERWLDANLRESIKHVMIQMVKQNEKKFLKHSGVFELFAVDFVMSDSGLLHLMNVQASPKYLFKTILQSQFNQKLISDMLEIEYAYLRSRVTRIREIIPEIHGTIAKTQKVDFDSYKKKFNKANKNGEVDSLFAISKKNDFTMIYNANKEDPAFGLIDSSCI